MEKRCKAGSEPPGHQSYRSLHQSAASRLRTKSHHNQQAIEYYKKVLPQAWTPQQRSDVLKNMVTAYRQMGDDTSSERVHANHTRLPPQSIDWQGAWWKQILPILKQHLHIGSSSS